MIIPTKKLKSGFEMPVYGLGTWRMGGAAEPDTTNDQHDIVAIKMSLESGVRHIDTAEMYGGGHSEELIAEALKQTKIPRQELFITSKMTKKAPSPQSVYGNVIQSCEESLRRLNTDYLDLYLVHFPPPCDIDIRDVMRDMNELVRQGVVKNIGVANLTPHRYEIAQENSANKLVCNQVQYSLMVREAEKLNLPQHAIDNDYFLTAWRPLQLSYEPGVNSYPPIVEEMAAKYGKTPNQIAINWLISQPNIVTLSKTSNPEHLEENLGAIDWQMSEEDIEKMRNDYPPEYFVEPRYKLDKIESSMTA